MAATILPRVTESRGYYTFRKKPTAAQIVALATSILEDQITGEVISNPDETRRYLSLKLANLEHEVFGCLFLDNRHRVISFDVRVFDHIVVGAAETVSFCERGLL